MWKPIPKQSFAESTRSFKCQLILQKAINARRRAVMISANEGGCAEAVEEETKLSTSMQRLTMGHS